MPLKQDVPAMHRPAGLIDGGRQDLASVDYFNQGHASVGSRQHFNSEFPSIGNLLSRSLQVVHDKYELEFVLHFVQPFLVAVGLILAGVGHRLT